MVNQNFHAFILSQLPSINWAVTWCQQHNRIFHSSLAPMWFAVENMGKTLSLVVVFDSYERETWQECEWTSKNWYQWRQEGKLNRVFKIIFSYFSPDSSAFLPCLNIAFWEKTLKWVLLEKPYHKSTSFMTAISQ